MPLSAIEAPEDGGKRQTPNAVHVLHCSRRETCASVLEQLTVRWRSQDAHTTESVATRKDLACTNGGIGEADLPRQQASQTQ